DAREVEPGGGCEGARHERLGDAGHVVEQHVAVGEQAGEHELEHVALADDGLLDLREQALRGAGGSGDRVRFPGSVDLGRCAHSFSRSSRMTSSWLSGTGSLLSPGSMSSHIGSETSAWMRAW